MIKKCLPCDFQFLDKKQMVFCQFCGLSACQDCTKKTRIFAMSTADHTGKRERGIICKLCDRKFFIKEMMQKSIKEIEMQNVVIQLSKTKVNKANEEYNQQKAELDAENAKIQQQVDAMETEIKKITDTIAK